MKPCPFCGGTEIQLVHRILGNVDRYTAYYRCEHCLATGSNFVGNPKTDGIKDSAKAAWNGEHG